MAVHKYATYNLVDVEEFAQTDGWPIVTCLIKRYISFNENIGSWNVSNNATDMACMFLTTRHPSTKIFLLGMSPTSETCVASNPLTIDKNWHFKLCIDPIADFFQILLPTVQFVELRTEDDSSSVIKSYRYSCAPLR
eukprot:scaffold84419_cov52-Attheya_sp.AAC.2